MTDLTHRLREHRTAVVIVAAVVVGLAVWLLFVRGDDSGSGAETTGPTIVSESELKDAASSAGHPVYWAGPQPGARYELSRPEGKFYVRYLTGDAVVADPSPNFLTIGTYPAPNAFGALEVVGKRAGSKIHPIAGGGIVVTQSSRPQSVYLANPDQPFQIEIYDPSGQKAEQLALSGQIVPIE